MKILNHRLQIRLKSTFLRWLKNRLPFTHKATSSTSHLTYVLKSTQEKRKAFAFQQNPEVTNKGYTDYTFCS